LKTGDVVLGKYRINKCIGEGSNGVTYSAIDTESNATVAVKELKLGAMKSWKQFELFEREATTLRALNHPGIPKYVDYSSGDGRVILVQELADGPNLSQMVRGGTRFDEGEVERIAKELLAILKYLSSRRCFPFYLRSPSLPSS
jgi:eukaryotic-like serine/threonine-protein kinase